MNNVHVNINLDKIVRRNPFDIRKPETFTAQRIFDYVVARLAEQGRASMLGNVCVYRGHSGTKCAVGHLIPDEMYKASMEINESGEIGATFSYLLTKHLDLHALGAYQELLEDLQNAHDGCRDVEALKEALRVISRLHWLKPALVGTITKWEH